MEQMTKATRRTPVLYFDCVACGKTKHRNQFPPSAVHTNGGRRRCSECPQKTRKTYQPREGANRANRRDRAFDRAHPVAAVPLEIPDRCPHCTGWILVQPYPINHTMGYGGWKCVNCGRGQV